MLFIVNRCGTERGLSSPRVFSATVELVPLLKDAQYTSQNVTTLLSA